MKCVIADTGPLVAMSFADACLVRMFELWPEAPVFTLDSDFRVYRRNKRQSLPLVCPERAAVYPFSLLFDPWLVPASKCQRVRTDPFDCFLKILIR